MCRQLSITVHGLIAACAWFLCLINRPTKPSQLCLNYMSSETIDSCICWVINSADWSVLKVFNKFPHYETCSVSHTLVSSFWNLLGGFPGKYPALNHDYACVSLWAGWEVVEVLAAHHWVHDYACVSLWAWWEVVAAHHWVHHYACVSLWAWWEVVEVVAAHHCIHDYACCHLQTDCLESGISCGPMLDYKYRYLYLYLSL